MKNVLKIVAILFFAGNMAFANNPDDVKVAKLKVQVIEHKDQMIAVHYATTEEGTVWIRIRDHISGATVYSERTSDHKLVIKKYDVSDLPAGKYVIEVRSGKELIKKTVEL